MEIILYKFYSNKKIYYTNYSRNINIRYPNKMFITYYINIVIIYIVI